MTGLCRYEHGMIELDALSTSSFGEYFALSSSYVTDYGDMRMFSQKFAHDVSNREGGLPYMLPRPDEEVAAAFYQFVSSKKLDVASRITFSAE